VSVSNIRFSLGWNFDPELIQAVHILNKNCSGVARIDEVYGTLPDSPILSARPISRVPRVSWAAFEEQVLGLKSGDVHFNFLMNTVQSLDSELIEELPPYLDRLAQIGVRRLTVGTPALASFVKTIHPDFHVTISITWGASTLEQVWEIESAGADAVVLDAVKVNRDFELLRNLVKISGLECRLYANMSCLSNCPVVREHYDMFSNHQDETTALLNDAFFLGCCLVKMHNPIEWIQMPWIRPEDVPIYASEGISFFKLSDRLASSSTLSFIAKSYLSLESVEDLFPLIERDGAKFGVLYDSGKPRMSVMNKKIPRDFIEHFRSGQCTSRDLSCDYCGEVASKSVDFDMEDRAQDISASLLDLVPPILLGRAKSIPLYSDTFHAATSGV